MPLRWWRADTHRIKKKIKLKGRDEVILRPFLNHMDKLIKDSPESGEEMLSEAFIKVEETIKSFHELLESLNRESHSTRMPEEDLKARLVAAMALRDSATIYLDWGWHYLSRLYDVPNPHNPEEDFSEEEFFS